MCGIVGVIAKRDVAGDLIEGLKMLEYRGYDSAGIALIDDDEMTVHKAVGRISELEAKLDESPGGHIGIAHTRWATHGAPSEPNAHPHLSANGRFAIVHNGIIENCNALRELLTGHGFVFKSETDSEVIAHLIEHCYRNSTLQAVRDAIGLLDGAFGILVLDREDPHRLIAARLGSPLVIGIGENEYFAASDIAAIVGHTRQVIYLEDGELAELSLSGYRTSTFDDHTVVREPTEIDWEIDQIELAGFDHFMLKEIFEQPEALRLTMAGRARLDGIHLGGIADITDDEVRKMRRVVISACGTAWHSGLVGKYLLEQLARLEVEVDYASEFRYRDPVIGPGDLFIVITQSGETADTLAAMREARQRGARVMAICNVVGATIARESGMGVYTHAGPEIGVASTKAFTTQVAVMTMLAIHWGRLRGHLGQDRVTELLEGLAQLPEQVAAVCEQCDAIKVIAEQYADAHNFLFLGRGVNFPIALEGALKLKEISYIHAEGYPAAEMKHGPIALIDEDMPCVVIANHQSSVYDKVLSNIQEIRARHGKVIVIASEGDTQLAEHCDHIITVPDTAPELSPIINVIPLQLLSYHIAAKRGCDIDKPRNLAKSVTVE